MTGVDRRCACGCGESLAGRRIDCKWNTDACRKRGERRDAASRFWSRYRQLRRSGRLHAARRAETPDKARNWEVS